MSLIIRYNTISLVALGTLASSLAGCVASRSLGIGSNATPRLQDAALSVDGSSESTLPVVALSPAQEQSKEAHGPALPHSNVDAQMTAVSRPAGDMIPVSTRHFPKFFGSHQHSGNSSFKGGWHAHANTSVEPDGRAMVIATLENRHETAGMCVEGRFAFVDPARNTLWEGGLPRSCVAARLDPTGPSKREFVLEFNLGREVAKRVDGLKAIYWVSTRPGPPNALGHSHILVKDSGQTLGRWHRR